MGFFDSIKKSVADAAASAREATQNARAEQEKRANAGSTRPVGSQPRPAQNPQVGSNVPGWVPKPQVPGSAVKKGIDLTQQFVIKFGTQNPIPFEDAKYRAIYINVNGMAKLTARDPLMYDGDKVENMIKAWIIIEIEKCLSEMSGRESIDTLPMHARNISQRIGKELTGRGFDVASVAIAGISPDKASMDRIKSMKMASDPNLAAQEMAKAVAAAQATMKATATSAALGSAAGASLTSAPSASSAASAPAPSECPYCGSSLAPGAKFCTNCGVKL